MKKSALILLVILFFFVFDWYTEDVTEESAIRTYLFIGSSHMSGRVHRFDFHSSKLSDFYPINRAVNAIGDGWELAKPPINKYRLGPVDFIGRYLSEVYPSDRIALVCATKSGLDFEDFTPEKENSHYQEVMHSKFNADSHQGDWAERRGGGFVVDVKDTLFRKDQARWDGVVYCGNISSGEDDIEKLVNNLRKDLGVPDLPIVFVPSPGSSYGQYMNALNKIKNIRFVDVYGVATRVVFDEEKRHYSVRNHHWNRDSISLISRWVVDAFKSIESAEKLEFNWSGWKAEEVQLLKLPYVVSRMVLDPLTGQLIVAGAGGERSRIKHTEPLEFKSPRLLIDKNEVQIVPAKAPEPRLPKQYIKSFNNILSVQRNKLGDYLVLDADGVYVIDLRSGGAKAVVLESNGFSNMIWDDERSALYLSSKNTLHYYKCYWEYGDKKRSFIKEEKQLSETKRIVLEAELIQTSKPLSLDKLEQYKEQLLCSEFRVRKVISGNYESSKVLTVHLAMKDRELIQESLMKPGEIRTLELGLWSEDKSYQNRPLADDINDFVSDIYFIYNIPK